MEQTDETESNECAVQIQKGEQEADLCLHSHQLFPGVKVTLLYFLLKSLTGRRETMGRRVSQQKKYFVGLRKDSCLSGLFLFTTISCHFTKE